jgi:ribosomal protein L2
LERTPRQVPHRGSDEEGRPEQHRTDHGTRRGGGARSVSTGSSISSARNDVAATVERIEYDPNRTAFIALVRYEDGEQAYILAPQRLAVGDR